MVDFLHSEGVDIISYAATWSGASLEAEKRADILGMQINEHRNTFKLIDRLYSVA